MEKREDWYAVAFLTVFGLFVFMPLLFFGYVSAGNEQIGFYYALTHFTETALQTGTSLVWNSANYGGESATFNQFASAWNPLNRTLFFFFSFFTVQHLSIALSTIGGLICAYWFGRRQGWLSTSSLTLSLAYLSAVTYGWLQVGTLPSAAFAVAPALLLFLQFASHAKTKKQYALYVMCGALVMSFGFLAGFMQFLLYNTCIAGLYALFLDWEKRVHVHAWYQHLQTIFALACMTVLGLLVGFKQWFPSTILMNLSVRTDTFAMQHATFPAITELIAYAVPPYLEVPYIGGGSAEGFYIGALGIVCALIGILYYRTRTTLFFMGSYILVFLFAWHAPLLSWINEHTTPFSHMSGNFRWLVAGAFPLAYLGAAGVEGLLRAPDRLSAHARTSILWGSASIAALLVCGSLIIRIFSYYAAASPSFLTKVLTWYTNGRALTHEHAYYLSLLAEAFRDVSELFSLSNPRFVFGIFCWILAWGALYLLLYTPNRRTRVLAVSVCMIVTVGGACALQWDQFVPRTMYEKTPALVTYLDQKESDQYTYRILGILVGDGLYRQYFSSYQPTAAEASIVHRETLANSTNLLYGIDSMGGLRPYQTLRMNQLLGTVVAYETEGYVFDPLNPNLEGSTLSRMYNTDVQKKVSVEEKKNDLLRRLPLFSMMNVKYLYSPELFEDSRLPLVETIHIPVADGIPLYVYENKTVLPRIYFSMKQNFIASSDKEVLLKVADIADFSRETVIECGECTSATAHTPTVVVLRYENGNVEVETTSDADAWLVFSESANPGWAATIDGTKSALYTANYLFQAIRVPEGKHTVHFNYHDPGMPDLLTSAAEVF